MRWHYKEIEKRKGVRYNDCRSVTNPPTKNRKVSLLGTGGKRSHFLWLLFLCKNAADDRKYQPPICPDVMSAHLYLFYFVSECFCLVCGLSEVIVYG